MFNDLFYFISFAFGSVFGWFASLLDTVGLTDVFIGVFFVAMTYRFLLAPLFKGGGTGSDKAKKSSFEGE